MKYFCLLSSFINVTITTLKLFLTLTLWNYLEFDNKSYLFGEEI